MTSASRAAERRGARRIERRPTPPDPIRFGTSGWRGALGEEVSFPRLRVLVRSIADWIREDGAGQQVLVGWDRRLASQAMAESAAAILTDSGLHCDLVSMPTATPVLTHALGRGRYAAGLALTASHNPALDHGLKLFDRFGATISDASARRIEAIAASRMQDDGAPDASAPARRVDPLPGYVESVSSLLDATAFARSPLVVHYDAMHGCGAGVLDRVLGGLGARVEILRASADPGFGGAAPDPRPATLEALARRVASTRTLSIGLATDGDGDRFGVVDGRGRVLTETQVIALLVDHLAEAGLVERGVALTVGTGSLVEKVARSRGLRVERHPVGFKHVSAAIHAGRADLGGEESGGFALARIGIDKDGILAGCLLAQLVATSGVGLEDHVDRLEAEFGASACGRTSIGRSPPIDRALERIEREPPRDLDGVAVLAAERDAGLRLILADSGFLMFRQSGTESKVRIYAEAPTQPLLEQRLAAGCDLLVGDACGPSTPG